MRYAGRGANIPCGSPPAIGDLIGISYHIKKSLDAGAGQQLGERNRDFEIFKQRVNLTDPEIPKILTRTEEMLEASITHFEAVRDRNLAAMAARNPKKSRLLAIRTRRRLLLLLNRAQTNTQHVEANWSKFDLEARKKHLATVRQDIKKLNELAKHGQRK
jgi:hypothetical protein